MVRILLTGYTDAEALVEAINCGLVDTYLTKPWNNADLRLRVARALDQYLNNKKQSALEVGNERLQARLKEMSSALLMQWRKRCAQKIHIAGNTRRE